MKKFDRRALFAGAAASVGVSILPRSVRADAFSNTPPPPRRAVQIGATPLVRGASTRSCWNANAYSDGYFTQQSTRFRDTLANAQYSSIRVLFENIGGMNVAAIARFTESTPPEPITISAMLEVHPTRNGPDSIWSISDAAPIFIPIRFNGALSTTIAPDGFIYSDPIVYPFLPQQAVYINTDLTVGGTKVIPTNRVAAGSFYETKSDGQFSGIFNTSSTPTTSYTCNVTGATTGTAAGLPLVPGSVGVFGISANPGLIINADAAGNFPAGNGIVSGTVNFSTGDVAITLSSSQAPSGISMRGFGLNGVGSTFTQRAVGAGASNLNVLTTASFGHAGIVGTLAYNSTKRPFSILKVGDSIMWGTGNNTDNARNWVDYANAQRNNYAVLSIARPGEGAASMCNPLYNHRRLATVAGLYDRIIEDLGCNDFIPGATLTQVQNYKLQLWATLAAQIPNGINDLYVSTLLPNVTSASNNTPVAWSGPGTVASGSPSLRNAYNAWLYTQIGVTIGGVIDAAAAVENAPASQAGAGDGKWASLGDTADGLHPNYSGYTKIGTATAPHQAFA